MNCLPQVMMTKIFVPRMLKRSKKSAIIDVSSVLSYLPSITVYIIYAATKSFNRFLATGYTQEIGDSKIDFECFLPAHVTTQMTRYVTHFPAISPLTCAEGALMDLGIKSSRRIPLELLRNISSVSQ